MARARGFVDFVWNPIARDPDQIYFTVPHGTSFHAGGLMFRTIGPDWALMAGVPIRIEMESDLDGPQGNLGIGTALLLPPTGGMLEAELMGHVSIAFTGGAFDPVPGAAEDPEYPRMGEIDAILDRLIGNRVNRALEIQVENLVNRAMDRRELMARQDRVNMPMGVPDRDLREPGVMAQPTASAVLQSSGEGVVWQNTSYTVNIDVNGATTVINGLQRVQNDWEGLVEYNENGEPIHHPVMVVRPPSLRELWTD